MARAMVRRMAIDHRTIRKRIVLAVASDDVLVRRLVLKGGNALELIYGIGNRASLDLDFSIEGDLEDCESIGRRLEKALSDRFDAVDLIVFDYRFGIRPKSQALNQPSKEGGYTAEFKLIERGMHLALRGDLPSLQRQAMTTGASQHRVFKIDISKYEYCQDRVETELDAYPLLVYTPAMIAAEKLRAICQQMPEYARRAHPAPRARDFYDI